MSSLQAFELRDDAPADIGGISISVPPDLGHPHQTGVDGQAGEGDMFDALAALHAGGGTIVVDTSRHAILAAQLKTVPVLRECDVPDGYTPPQPPLAVDPAVAGLSGAANEGRPVDAYGDAYVDAADVPDDAVPPDPPLPDGHAALDDLTVPQLREYAGELADQDPAVEVDLSGATTKTDIVGRFRAAGVLSAPINLGD